MTVDHRDITTHIHRMLDERLPGLTDPERHVLQAVIASEAEMWVGEVLSAELTDAQLAEFEALFDSGDEDAAGRCLESALPDYRDRTHDALLELACRVVDLAADRIGRGEPLLPDNTPR